MSIGWKFADATVVSGGNDGAIDTFAGTRVHSMVREIIQNSLDAHDKKNSEPVRVTFSLAEISRSEIDGLDELAEHLKACKAMASGKQNNKKQAKFYENAGKIISKKKVPVLCVSDFNTTGLTGSTRLHDASGQWIALTKGVGLTQKTGGSLGSFGHGSKAPFTMSPLRSIYYLTETENLDGNKETRFQGKSLLQSHFKNDELLDGTGYYGHTDGGTPLLNEDVPKWASSLRALDGEGKGTSILIPFTDFDHGLFPETLITVISNFYYVFRLGKLEVVVNGEAITQDNCDEIFIQAKDQLPYEQDGIDVNLTQERLKTIDTILQPEHDGMQQIAEFGRIDWFLSVGGNDTTGRSVSIARESGMFITRKAPQLQRFPGKKPFDMFVHVTPGKGSDLLKDLENPAHDKFELDRVNDRAERIKIEGVYRRFTEAVKEIIDRYAAVEHTDETVVDDFDEIYSRSVNSDANDQGAERGSKMFISPIGSPKPRTGNAGSGTQTGTIPATGEGRRGGKGKKKTEGGVNVTTTGAGTTVAEGGNLNTNRSAIQAQGLRVNRLSKGNLKVHFNCYKEGDFQFQLFKVGEGGIKTPIVLMADGKESSIRNIKISQGVARANMTVELKTESDSSFTMEAWLNEIK